jgi:glyoxylase-like metal-dependent hydrolase (beta-lactamase superfamily II)
MFTPTEPHPTASLVPYIPQGNRLFPTQVFATEETPILPMWSGEGNLSYLVVNRTTREALLIDPDLEILGAYLLTLDRNALRLAAVIDTHTHAEHATAGPTLKTLFGVPYVMHQNAPTSAVTHRVSDGEEQVLGGIPVAFHHTPGHTRDLLTLRIGQHLFTGDSLFNASCGRTDLPGGDAAQQHASIHRIADFPDDFVIHPGHDYNNRLSITVGEAKRLNPRLQFATPEDFTRFMQQAYATEEKPDDLEFYVAFNSR